MVGDKVPEEIIYEILLRLPVKSLIRFTAVCKSWSCMIKSSTFIHTHLINRAIESNDPNNNGVQLLLHDPILEIFSLYLDDDSASSTLREYTSLGNTPPHRVTVSTENETDEDFEEYCDFVGTCNGLVCVVVLQEIGTTTVVWNPSIRKFVVLPKAGVTLTEDYHPGAYAFGYDRRANDYKVLAIIPYCWEGQSSCEAKVWSFARGSWKTLNAAVVPEDLYFFHGSAFVNGALHLVGASETTGNLSLVSFDISDEVFAEIGIPLEAETRHRFDFRKGRSCTVSGYRDSLVFFESCPSSGGVWIHMWVMKEDGVGKSWARLFAIWLQLETEDGTTVNLVGFRNSGELVLRIRVSGKQDDQCLSVNPKTREVKNFRIEEEGRHMSMGAFTESLVLLDQPNVNKY